MMTLTVFVSPMDRHAFLSQQGVLALCRFLPLADSGHGPNREGGFLQNCNETDDEEIGSCNIL